MKKAMIAVALSAGLFTAQAQTSPDATTSTEPQSTAKHPPHNCMMADEKVWASLDLSPEQTEKVKAIQAECMKECAGMMKDDPSMAKMMDKHEPEVQAVLKPSQYDAWMKWCSAQATSTEAKPMDKVTK